MNVQLSGDFLHLRRQHRSSDGDFQTTGELVWHEDFTAQKRWSSLEPPWRDNQRRVSSIPNGVYRARRRWSQKYGSHFHILDVPDRDYILIHPGNYATHTAGCVLVGMSLLDINGDGRLDVANSRHAMNQMLVTLPESFVVLVTSDFDPI